jgi:hypothetical protein
MKQRYYRTEEEFEGIRSRLKNNPCPHCRITGCLILHGYLYGYKEDTSSKKVKRGHRIFCNNRLNRKVKGCGRTFSILISGFIKNHILTALSVWSFLKNIKEKISLASSFRASGGIISDTGIYRIIRKFKENQVKIRTLLTRIKEPPSLKHTNNSAIQTIEHLKSAFSDSTCPVTEFQYHFQTSFL